MPDACKDIWINQYNELCGWVESKGYDVVCYTDADDKLEFEEKRIHIDSRQHAENRFYTLIHECGHLLISQTARQFQKDHPMSNILVKSSNICLAFRHNTQY